MKKPSKQKRNTARANSSKGRQKDSLSAVVKNNKARKRVPVKNVHLVKKTRTAVFFSRISSYARTIGNFTKRVAYAYWWPNGRPGDKVKTPKVVLISENVIPTKKNRRIFILNTVFAILFLLGVVFSIFQLSHATTPNPGHPWTDIGNGLWAASNTQTSLRTFTFPDTNATVLTSSSSLIIYATSTNANFTPNTSSNTVLYADATAGSFTITLPTASGNAGLVYFIKRIDYAANYLVTIAPQSGQTIDNASTTLLTRNAQVVTLQSNGSNWVSLDQQVYDVNAYRTRGASTTALTQWYTSPVNGTAIANATALTTNTLYAMPLVIPTPSTIDMMSIDVGTISAGGTAELGIYADTGNGYPGALVDDCGSVSVATAAPVTCSTGMPVTLSPGLYWMTIVASGTPIVHDFSVAQIMPVLGYSSSTVVSSTIGWKSTFTKAALTSPFPGTATGTLLAAPLPAIFVHFLK